MEENGTVVQFILGYNHFVGASGDIVISPFNNDSVAALVLDGVGDVIELVTHVLHIHLLAGSLWSVHAHHQHVGTWTRAVRGGFDDYGVQRLYRCVAV